MLDHTPGPPPHPILAAAADIEAALKSVADTNPTFMSTPDKATALRLLATLQSGLGELSLRILAHAGDLAEQTADRDAAGWLAHHTRARVEDARADQSLALALDRRYPVLAAAVRDGGAHLPQARAVVRCLDDLPAEIPADVVARAEHVLVEHCARFDPRQLTRLGRHIVAVVAPGIAEQAEARRLADLERSARRRTRLTLLRIGDGTTRISGVLPDASASRLATYLHAFTSPRKDADRPDGTEDTRPSGARQPAYPRRLGEAFCQLLESLDSSRLPVHGGDATTVVVTIGLDALRSELGIGTLLSGGDLPGADDPGTLTAAEVRRLACTAAIIPAVVGGASVPVDVGRARRLFDRHQRTALLVRDRGCRAEGCSIPGTWCEAHHWQPWQRGGGTDLTNGILLCAHHHHRAHDPAHRAERLASGDVRFHKRR
jgi:hypothetical protein